MEPSLRCKRKVLSGTKSLLEIVRLEATAERVRAGWIHIRRAGGREFQIVVAATLKPRAPNERGEKQVDI